VKSKTKGSGRLKKLPTIKKRYRNEKKKKLPVSLPISCINIFYQPRQTFDEIEELAGSINRHGLMHPLSVARFSREEMMYHLSLRNLSKKHSFPVKIEDIKPSYKGCYHVLIAGERRFKAIEMIVANIGRKFRKDNTFIFIDRKIECNIYKSPSFFKFISMQIEENNHLPPAVSDVAEYIDIFYHALKTASEIENKKLTMVAFAKKIGKSPNSIRSALKFSDLPFEIKIYVSSKLISYGVACEIARLKIEIKAKSSELMWWANIGVGKNLKDFKSLIEKRIQEKKSGEVSFFEELSTEALLKQGFTKIMNERVMRMLFIDYSYVKKVLTLFEDGQIGKELSAFNNVSIIRMLGKIVEMLSEKILPHIQTLEEEEYFKKCLNEAKQNDLIDNIKDLQVTHKKIIS
jgi:ParB-like chromosome segregation protein Spo0J